MADFPRVLSVQSHVVSGYVGNKSAIFPLQLLGFDVDFINSVQFTNHTGYPVVKGSVLNGEDLSNLAEGLEQNELLNYDYMLTGYIGSESFLDAILSLLTRIEARNPHIKYVCDPVLGDNGQYYVPEGLVNIYREKVFPRAYMITPNQFEAQLLSGVSILNEETALQALIKLHKLGPKVVILTSAEFEGIADTLHCYALIGHSSSASSDSSTATIARVVVPKVPGYFTGTGDATAALLLGYICRTKENIAQSLQYAIGAVQGIIKQTHEYQTAANLSADASRAAKMRLGELNVVRGKKHIESPDICNVGCDVWTIDL